MASSAKQIAANRANGKKGKGPISVEGKRISSQNATVHGVLSTAQSLTTARHLNTADTQRTNLPHALAKQAIPDNSAHFIRYQSQLEGQYYRALTMLHVVQDRRKHHGPVNVDNLFT